MINLAAKVIISKTRVTSQLIDLATLKIKRISLVYNQISYL